MAALREVWITAGLEAVETRAISVQRCFADFEDCWRTFASFSITGPAIAAMTPNDLDYFNKRLQARLMTDTKERVTYAMSANAINGLVPMAA